MLAGGVPWVELCRGWTRSGAMDDGAVLTWVGPAAARVAQPDADAESDAARSRRSPLHAARRLHCNWLSGADVGGAPGTMSRQQVRRRNVL
eukprot:1132481-Rhodomonas_salina.1